MIKEQLKIYLDKKVEEYNTLDFIESDPIQIPHHFSLKEDVEISGFLTSTIAWGNRKMIIKNAMKMMDLMDDAPYDYIMNHESKDLICFKDFVHRTFNSEDLIFFIQSLKNIYSKYHDLEHLFVHYLGDGSLQDKISRFKQVFFEIEHQKRVEKHVSDPLKNSAAKRLNMWLRWMVRHDENGVDFGIWKKISASELSCPLDVHSGNAARRLGLLSRKQNDAKAVFELDERLRQMDASDPVKYDFALFGISVNYE